MICSSVNLDRFIVCPLCKEQTNSKLRTFQGSRSTALTDFRIHIGIEWECFAPPVSLGRVDIQCVLIFLNVAPSNKPA